MRSRPGAVQPSVRRSNSSTKVPTRSRLRYARMRSKTAACVSRCPWRRRRSRRAARRRWSLWRAGPILSCGASAASTASRRCTISSLTWWWTAVSWTAMCSRSAFASSGYTTPTSSSMASVSSCRVTPATPASARAVAARSPGIFCAETASTSCATTTASSGASTRREPLTAWACSATSRCTPCSIGAH